MLKELVYKADKAQFAADRKEWLAEADRMIAEHGWQEMTVTPYGFATKVTELVDRLRDYDSYTEDSRWVILSEIRGLTRVLNAWEEYEKAPKVEVRRKSDGKVIRIRIEDIPLFGELVEADGRR